MFCYDYGLIAPKGESSSHLFTKRKPFWTGSTTGRPSGKNPVLYPSRSQAGNMVIMLPTSTIIGSLSKDNSNGNYDAGKQWSVWSNEKKLLCCTCNTHFSRILWQSLPKWLCEISKFKVLTWTHNSKFFILNIYFYSQFAACSVNNKGGKEEAIITK